MEQEKKIRERWKEMKEAVKPAKLFRKNNENTGFGTGVGTAFITGLSEAAIAYVSSRVKTYTGQGTAELIRTGLEQLAVRLQRKRDRKRKAT